MIGPRWAGTWMSASCWVTAARLSVPAFTTPSQAALLTPSTRRARNVAKSRPMRRSTRRTAQGAWTAPVPGAAVTTAVGIGVAVATGVTTAVAVGTGVAVAT